MKGENCVGWAVQASSARPAASWWWWPARRRGIRWIWDGVDGGFALRHADARMGDVVVTTSDVAGYYGTEGSWRRTCSSRSNRDREKGWCKPRGELSIFSM